MVNVSSTATNYRTFISSYYLASAAVHAFSSPSKTKAILEGKSPALASNQATILTPHVYNSDGSIDHDCKLGKIHVQPLLTKEEAEQCHRIALEHARESKCWEDGKMSGTQHASYNTVDFPLIEFPDEEVEDDNESVFLSDDDPNSYYPSDNPLATYLADINFDERIFQKLESCFGLTDLFYEDLFCVQYVAKEEDVSGVGMDSLDFHRDGTLLSFTILLSDPNSFTGGGTVFECLKEKESTHLFGDENVQCLVDGNGAVKPLEIGTCVLHSGKLFHGGAKVTQGTRIVIVGFVGVPEWFQEVDSIINASRDWGRLDVLEKRLKRQDIQTRKNNKYVIRNRKWLPNASSLYNGYYPSSNFIRSYSSSSLVTIQRRQEIEKEFFRTIIKT